MTGSESRSAEDAVELALYDQRRAVGEGGEKRVLTSRPGAGDRSGWGGHALRVAGLRFAGRCPSVVRGNDRAAVLDDQTNDLAFNRRADHGAGEVGGGGFVFVGIGLNFAADIGQLAVDFLAVFLGTLEPARFEFGDGALATQQAGLQVGNRTAGFGIGRSSWSCWLRGGGRSRP